MRSKTNSQFADDLRRRRKKYFVEKLGGKCMRCGYNKSIRALCFHHKDPSTKSFPLNSKYMTKNIKVLEEEISKCELLCSNCHMEEHDKYLAEEEGIEPVLAD